MEFRCIGASVPHLGAVSLTPTWIQTLIMIILIPLPLFFSSTVYGVGGLTGKSDGDHNSAFELIFVCFVAWVVIGMIWTFCSSFIVVLYPLWESRVAIGQIAGGIVKVGVPHVAPL